MCSIGLIPASDVGLDWWLTCLGFPCLARKARWMGRTPSLGRAQGAHCCLLELHLQIREQGSTFKTELWASRLRLPSEGKRSCGARADDQVHVGKGFGYGPKGGPAAYNALPMPFAPKSASPLKAARHRCGSHGVKLHERKSSASGSKQGRAMSNPTAVNCVLACLR